MQAAQLGQQAEQFQAGIGKDIGLAGLTAGLQGSQALGALGAQQQGTDIERLRAQAASAGESQAMEQERLNQQYQQFMDKQNFQKAQLDYLSNILRGNAGALGQTQVQYAPAPSIASQLGGLGLAGLGLYNVLGGKK
jgi:phage I-like protein